jgi:alkylresorcinol/alkylpyrone synthase
VKVIDAIESALDLPQGELNLEREVLHDYGNMSAPSVSFRARPADRRGLPSRVMMTAFGPGFTCAGLVWRRHELDSGCDLGLVTHGAACRAG